MHAYAVSDRPTDYVILISKDVEFRYVEFIYVEFRCFEIIDAEFRDFEIIDFEFG